MPMQINSINTILYNTKLPLESAIGTNVMLALNIMPMPEYLNGKRTDKIIGYVYECVDEISYKHYSIKIKGQTEPIMSNNELQQLRKTQRVMLEFKNPTVFMYYNRNTLTLEDSFSAEDVMLVTD